MICLYLYVYIHFNPDEFNVAIKVKDGIKEESLMETGGRTKNLPKAKWIFS